jgi:hypothetical protein
MPVGTSGVDQRGNCVDDVPLPNAFTVAPIIVDNIPRPRDTAQWIVGFCAPTECFERIWTHLSYSPFNDSTYERALKGKSERQNFGNKRISREKSTSLLVPARPERPAMHSKRAPNFVSRPNIALPRNENRPVSSAVR